MKRILASILLVLAWALAMPAAAQSDPGFLAEMQRLEESRNVAIRATDFGVLDRLYSEDFLGVVAGGRTVSRDDLFAIFRRAGGGFGPVDSRILSARRDGNFAFVVGRIAIQPPGGGRASASVFLHVFKRVGDEWRMVSGSATPEPAAAGSAP